MNVKHKIADLVGNTPLLELHNYGTNHNCGGKIFAKLESFNPGGSVKDRLALGMIQEAMKSGRPVEVMARALGREVPSIRYGGF